MDVVPGARPDNPLVVDQRPGFTVVIAAPETALIDLGLDNRVDPIRAAGRHIDTGLTNQLRQASAELFPGIATVGGLINTACGAA